VTNLERGTSVERLSEENALYEERQAAPMPRKEPGPSVKDKEMYEALREEGASKEKAARISNAAAASSRSDVGRRGGLAGDYEEWSKDDLVRRARELGIAGRSRMKKDELIHALRNH
jgi:hypothetical protein